jgi:hypothetical protein
MWRRRSRQIATFRSDDGRPAPALTLFRRRCSICRDQVKRNRGRGESRLSTCGEKCVNLNKNDDKRVVATRVQCSSDRLQGHGTCQASVGHLSRSNAYRRAQATAKRGRELGLTRFVVPAVEPCCTPPRNTNINTAFSRFSTTRSIASKATSVLRRAVLSLSTSPCPQCIPISCRLDRGT